MQDIRILLVEDNISDVKLLEARLSCIDYVKYELTRTKTIAEAKKILSSEAGFNIVLLDLALPDSAGFDTFFQIYNNFGDTPIVILTSNDDEELALKMVREGAQDYLCKGKVTGPEIIRTIEYSIHRHKLVRKLMDQSLRDKLTGLYNRRGFDELSQQKLLESIRSNKKAVLFYIDVNGLKLINDKFGHQAGDEAIKETARIIQMVFRESDIKERIGGDEFVILTTENTPEFESLIRDRLSKSLNLVNTQTDRKHSLDFSLGFVEYDPAAMVSVSDLLEKADKAMYQDKKNYYSQKEK